MYKIIYVYDYICIILNDKDFTSILTLYICIPPFNAANWSISYHFVPFSRWMDGAVICLHADTYTWSRGKRCPFFSLPLFFITRSSFLPLCVRRQNHHHCIHFFVFFLSFSFKKMSYMKLQFINLSFYSSNFYF